MQLVLERFMVKITPYLRELSLEERQALEKEVQRLYHNVYTLAARRGVKTGRSQVGMTEVPVDIRVSEPDHYTGLSGR